MSDQVIIQQNNIIISLLLQLHKKIDKKEKSEGKNISTTGVEELIEKLNKIEITPQQEKIVKNRKNGYFSN